MCIRDRPVVFACDLGFENGLAVWGIIARLFHPPYKFILIDTDQAAKFHGIDILSLPGNDHEVVSRFVVNQKFPVTVVYEASCRVLGDISENIIIGRKYILVDQDLHIKKPENENQPDSKEYPYDDQPPVSESPLHISLWPSDDNLRGKHHIAFMQGAVINEHRKLDRVINRVGVQRDGIDYYPFDGFVGIIGRKVWYAGIQ